MPLAAMTPAEETADHGCEHESPAAMTAVLDQGPRVAVAPDITVASAIRSRLAHGAALLAYLALGALVMGRFLADPAGHVSAHLAVDQTWFEWLLAHGAHVLAHGGNPLFSTAQNAPDGVNMMANTSALGVTIPLAPLTLVAGPRVAYVGWMILACAGTAATAYWVLQRYVVRSRAAAFAGGALAGFAPGAIHHANGQPNFVSNFALPLIVAAVFRLGIGGRPFRDGLVLGLLVTWQLFINEELLLVTALACGIGAAAYAMVAPPTARRRAPGFLTALAVTTVIAGLLCAYPIWFQFHGPRTFVGMPAFTDWGEDPVTYVTFARDTLAGSPQAEAVQGRIEQSSWFGWPLTLLLVVLAFVLWRRSVAARVATVVAAVCALLSLGPVLRFGGSPTGHPGPLALMPQHLPVLDLLMPSRLTFAVTGAAVLLVATAADRWRPGRVTVAAALIPLLPTPVPAMAERPVPVFISSGAWHDYVRPGAVLVPIPLPSNWLGRDALGWSAAAGHEFEVPEGYFLGPGPDGRGTMGPTFTSRTTQLVVDAWRTGEAPALTPADRQAVRTDVAGWHGEAIVMRAEAGNAALWEMISEVYGPPLAADDVWVWRP
jgi:hypothetical protein